LLQWAPGAYDAPFYVVPGYDSWSAQGTNFFWYDPLQDARGGSGPTGPSSLKAASTLQLSRKGVDCIKSYEGVRLEVYQDIAGNNTIGYGHLIKPGEDFSSGITEGQATELFRADLAIFSAGVAELIKVDISQNQFDALVSFAFNAGIPGFKRSALLSNLNSGQPVTEANFTDWNKFRDPVKRGLVVSDGLTARRKDEYSLFSSGVSTHCKD
jgi:lysozyme